MSRTQRICGATGVLAMAGVVVGMLLAPRDYFGSYLIAVFFWLGLSFGAAANLLLSGLTGGEWGSSLRPYLVPSIRALPVAAILFLPILLGLRNLYPWVDTPGPSGWLSAPFFIVRSLIYICVWCALAWQTRRAIASGGVPTGWSAIGLIIYGITLSLAAIDWIMSLMPVWYSTGFALVVITSQMLAGLSFSVLMQLAIERDKSDALLNDYGNLLLMYVLTWMYLAFTQYLIIWAADLPREIAWFVPRVQTTWRWLMLLVVVFLFALPFSLLLFRALKRNARFLRGVAALTCVAQMIYVFQLVAPTVRPQGFQLRWSDPLALLAVGGIWMTVWLSGVDKDRALATTNEMSHA